MYIDTHKTKILFLLLADFLLTLGCQKEMAYILKSPYMKSTCSSETEGSREVHLTVYLAVTGISDHDLQTCILFIANIS